MGRFTFQADDRPASSGDAKRVSVTFEDPPVQKQLPVASVAVVVKPSALNPGDKAQASASTFDANGRELQGRGIAWSSDNTAAAIVSPSGEVTAVGPGNVGIVASSEGKQGNFGLFIGAYDKSDWSGAKDRRIAPRRLRLDGAAPDGLPDRRSGNERRVANAKAFDVPISPRSEPRDLAHEYDPFIPPKSRYSPRAKPAK